MNNFNATKIVCTCSECIKHPNGYRMLAKRTKYNRANVKKKQNQEEQMKLMTTRRKPLNTLQQFLNQKVKSSVISNDANNFSAFNGGIFEGVTVLPDELQAFKDEKITWLTVNGGYGVIADRILPVFKTYTQLSMHLMILQRTMIRMKRPQ
ncbi:hypothetical protein RO3G_10548 [Rhizopus delemar RA 99-880]|uniref:Uncharacterized protein n=1 Tax=Rhizopus delemar (strain RA 99-880 / ATCC MYA-4621 / FGSC 9543 / NRRL 43880) TaxID=246409 RepID=I1CBK8_RHIO9|nr:hypothetical protein RO3G_10548 [Rhizopus delemar RA 99-880]|eukprot:EIE85838.1 hypothetical protein RO3G_10548 [Rhizopus delemar RA 99-880]